MSTNIEMNILKENEGYEILYPETDYNILLNIPSFLDKDNLVSESTAQLYGKDSTATVNDILNVLKTITDINAQNQFKSGSYIGNNITSKTITMNIKPNLVVLNSTYPTSLRIIRQFIAIRPNSNAVISSYSSNGGGNMRYVVSWLSNGITVNNEANNGLELNDSNFTYYWYAIGEKI